MSVTFEKFTRILSITLLIVWLGGCAITTARVLPSQTAAEPVPVIAEKAGVMTTKEPVETTQSLTQELLFDILAGEIAGQRNRMDVSVTHYLRAAAAANDSRVAERAAHIALYGKNFRAAMQATRRWLELDPDNINAHKNLMALALKLGENEEAVTQLDYLVSVSRTDEGGFRLASSLLSAHEDRAGAFDVMEQLAARHSDNPHAHVALARIALRAEQLERADNAVEKALDLEPGLSRALILKAQIRLQQEQKEAALDILKQGVEAAPEDAGMRLAYARVLLDSEMTAEAKIQYHEIARLTPDNTDVLYALALLELDDKNRDAAIELLDRVYAAGQRMDAVRFYMGVAKLGQGHDAEALDWYQQVEWGEFWSMAKLNAAVIQLKQGKKNVVREHMQKLRLQYPEEAIRIFLIEGQAHTEARQDDHAFDVYTGALAEYPGDEELLYSRALVAGKIGRIDQAEKDMRHILRNDPMNIRALNALGYTLADRTDRYDEALEFILQAYEKKPDDPAIIDSMGWVNYRLGNFDEAVRYLKQAWEMTINGEIGAHLGEVLWMQGEQEAARDVWLKSREIAPDDPVLQKVMDRFMP